MVAEKKEAKRLNFSKNPKCPECGIRLLISKQGGKEKWKKNK